MEKLPKDSPDIPKELLERFIDAMLSTQQGRNRLGFIPCPDEYIHSPFQCDIPLDREVFDLLSLWQEQVLEEIANDSISSRSISLESNGFDLISTVTIDGLVLNTITKPSVGEDDDFAYYASFFYRVSHVTEY